jgi:hypothetical protein
MDDDVKLKEGDCDQAVEVETDVSPKAVGGTSGDYHLLLDEPAEQTFGMTDGIAERGRKIRGTTLRYSEVVTTSLIEAGIDQAGRRTWSLVEIVRAS